MKTSIFLPPGFRLEIRTTSCRIHCPQLVRLFTTLLLQVGALLFVNPVCSSAQSDPLPQLLSQRPPLLSQGSTDADVRPVESLLAELPGGSLTDLVPLFPGTGTEPRYLAVGGSLTAGIRNGGLYREAQLTSYPNLIARQMGLKNFRQPLFESAQGNGSGYLRLTTSDPVPRFNRVANSVAITSTEPLTFAPVQGTVDNLSFPYFRHPPCLERRRMALQFAGRAGASLRTRVSVLFPSFVA